jgi:WD40 repeat protein
VTVWDLIDETPPRVLRGHRWPVYALGWSPDGKTLASSGWDNAIRLWDPISGACVEKQRDPDNPDNSFFGMAWSPDGQRLASGTYMHGVLVWEVTARSVRWVGRQLTTLIRCVAWSPDGTRLASGGAGQEGAGSGELFIWDAQSAERLQTLSGHAGIVFAVAWSKLGDLLVSGGSDGMLRWWDVQRGECVTTRKGHHMGVQSLRVSPDGQLLASCGDDNAIKVWDIQSAELLRTLRPDRPYERLNITRTQGLTAVQKATLLALGAFEEEVRN